MISLYNSAHQAEFLLLRCKPAVGHDAWAVAWLVSSGGARAGHATTEGVGGRGGGEGRKGGKRPRKEGTNTHKVRGLFCSSSIIDALDLPGPGGRVDGAAVALFGYAFHPPRARPSPGAPRSPRNMGMGTTRGADTARRARARRQGTSRACENAKGRDEGQIFLCHEGFASLRKLDFLVFSFSSRTTPPPPPLPSPPCSPKHATPHGVALSPSPFFFFLSWRGVGECPSVAGRGMVLAQLPWRSRQKSPHMFSKSRAKPTGQNPLEAPRSTELPSFISAFVAQSLSKG